MTKNQNETVLKMDREDLENEKKNELFRNGSTCKLTQCAKTDEFKTDF